MKLIDLHVHSNISDGTFSPSELIIYAHEKGLNAIALTDHDTVRGIDECTHKGAELGLTVIPGIECSADYYGTEFHILGYYIDPHYKPLGEQLDALVRSRNLRNTQILDKFCELGLPLTMEDLQEGCPPDTIFTRAHFAAALLRKGYITDRKEAFSKYLGKGKPAYIPRQKVSHKACIDMIHGAGGLAVLAHPLLYGYDYKEITQVLRALKKEGLDGVECLYSTHSKEDVFHLMRLCSELKLFPTGGSDFHGKNKPQLDLGTGYGDLRIPYSLLKAMESSLASKKRP